MAIEKSQVSKVVKSYIEILSMVSVRVALTVEQLVSMEVPALVALSVDDTLQCVYKTAR